MLDDSKRTTWIVEIDDTEDQGINVSGLGQTDEDVEGQGPRFGFLKSEGDDTEGQGYKFGDLRQTADVPGRDRDGPRRGWPEIQDGRARADR